MTAKDGLRAENVKRSHYDRFESVSLADQILCYPELPSTSIFANVLSTIEHIWIFFTHCKLCVAVVIHNLSMLKWVKVDI